MGAVLQLRLCVSAIGRRGARELIARRARSGHPARMRGAAIGLRRLASQRVAAGRLDEPAGGRALARRPAGPGLPAGAVGDRDASAARDGCRGGERDRRSRDRAHVADARHDPLRGARGRALAAGLCAPRLASPGSRAGAARHSRPSIERSRGAAAGGARRRSPPEPSRADRPARDAGIPTDGGHGYHILVRLAREGLICIGPMQGKQPTSSCSTTGRREREPASCRTRRRSSSSPVASSPAAGR